MQFQLDVQQLTLQAKPEGLSSADTSLLDFLIL